MKYVNWMKNPLIKLNNTALQIHAAMDRNHRDFKPDAAAEENARLQQELNAAADAARKDIDSTLDLAAAAVKKWADPAGGAVDKEDLVLLEGSFDLSRYDLHNLLVKHQGSGTMVNAIAKYAKDHGIVLDYVPNAKDKLHAYETFAKSAHSMVSSIVSSIGMNNNSPVLVEWGMPGNISQKMELVLYGLKEKEKEKMPVQPHAFNFDFKGLDGRSKA